MANLLTGSGGVIDTTIDIALKNLRSPIQTQRAINVILALCAFGIAVIGIFAVSLGPLLGFSFFAWSVLAAMASTFSGGVLGLLFGLPSARKVDARTTPAAAGQPVVMNYEESTSLEQISDWLTKIIVGLTLTQFATWSSAFDRLALTLTHDLLCPAQPSPCGYVPGASIVAGYALGGFVVAYMWTRRFFILEMVARDDSVRQMMRAQEQREQAAKEGRVQAGSDAPEGVVSDYSKVVDAILEDGRRNATGAAKKIAASLKAGDDPDDPWRGAFGGSPAANDAVLTATVTAVAGQPGNFKLDASVSGVTPERQRELAGQSLLFYLHPTFGQKVRVVSFGADGRASLVLYAYGAFTMGTLLEDGTTLELNLATLPGAPDQFKTN
jgi:hypothetical protein